MLFNSYEFIFLFFPLTFILFFGLAKYVDRQAAVVWLVMASFFFYGWWDFRYVPILLVSIVFNYYIGGRIRRGGQSKRWLLIGVVGNLMLLGYYKYTAFFLDTANTLLGYAYFDVPHIILPLGISFFTFTQTAYLVEEYRGEAKEHSFLTYCEFVTIFPHLIAGPIIRHCEMLPQFTDRKTFVVDYRNIAFGLTLFTMGLFKKTVVADCLSPWVADVFARTDSLTFLEAWIGAFSYTFQLYFDFSGYSEMAIGLGMIFNLQFPVNFNSPYQATSVIDFWRRWHITLGLWVRDYLYIPMGGNRVCELGKMRNLFLCMLLIGLWHGAGWTFVAWGGIHGVLLIINHQYRKLHIGLPKSLCWGLTFLCVTICWVLFRAENFHQAIGVLSAMMDIGNIALPTKNVKDFGVLQTMGITFAPWVMQVPLERAVGVLAACFLGLLFLPNPLVFMNHHFCTNRKWSVAVAVGLVIGILHIAKNSPFLYFQF